MPEKRQSAFIKATQAAQQAPTPAPVNTVTPLEGDTVTKQARPTVQREASAEPKVDKKVTFYLTQSQVDKLDQLEIDFRQIHKRKVNRNEIVRFLIDHCNIDNLEGL
ncbi:MAG: hypothetical protein H0V70_09895 [Ktedonobacteraceae bacterium]|nr:hypothetical protein [Ktedonobacteraceae bacterium]